MNTFCYGFKVETNTEDKKRRVILSLTINQTTIRTISLKPDSAAGNTNEQISALREKAFDMGYNWINSSMSNELEAGGLL